MFQSRGALVKATTLWQGNTGAIPTWVSDRWVWSSYAAIYRRQLWVYVLVNKVSHATARLPLKVYERNDQGRQVLRDHPYARLIARPNPSIDSYLFWLWVSATQHVYGEAFLRKRRDRLGRPVRLDPIHPTSVQTETAEDGTTRWFVGVNREQVPRRDLVHFMTYSPDTMLRGTSPLEPLRATLENEDGARRANSALWRNGSRPSVALKHPKTLSPNAQTNIRASWQSTYGGVDNWGVPAILEEGMEAQILSLNAEELQYIEGRKLNREEACAAFDVPPPVVHILDKATFSNITEQMRSMYRDTMAPKLGLLESVLETELRDGRMGADGDPDFGDEVYAEFLLDEVLRGDFETRTAAQGVMIQTGQATPAEIRQMENRPFLPGTDQLFINSAVVPLAPTEGMTTAELAQALQKIYLSVGTVISPEEAREILNRSGAGLPAAVPAGVGSAGTALRSAMGHLSRVESVNDIDEDALVGGLNGHADHVRAALQVARDDGMSVADFRTIVKELLS